MEICWPRVFFERWYVWEQDSLDICINHVNAGWTIKHLVLWSYGTDFRKKRFQIVSLKPISSRHLQPLLSIIPLIEEFLHQLIWKISHGLQGFIHVRNSSRAANFHSFTFTGMFRWSCFPWKRGQICAPKRKERQLFHLAGLGIVFVVNFYYFGKPPI